MSARTCGHLTGGGRGGSGEEVEGFRTRVSSLILFLLLEITPLL